MKPTTPRRPVIAGTSYDATNPAHRAELAAKLKQKLEAIGFTLSTDRSRDPGRLYGQGYKGREEVYVFKHRKDPGLEVQVFTSIAGGGEVRSKGADAIRVCLVYKNKAKQADSESAEARQYNLASECRVNRVGDIDDIVERTVSRAREAYKKANQVERCRDCTAPMALSQAGKQFCAEVCWTKRPGYKPKTSAFVDVASVLEAAATALEAGKVQAVEIGKHPDMFKGEDTPVVVGDWKLSSPEDLLAAARAGNLPSEDEIEEMTALQEQADADGDVDALLALGLSRKLAEAVANGLLDDLYEADEAGREHRIEKFVDYFRKHAEWEIEYRTEGEGNEYLIDAFQSELEDNVEEYAVKVRELLEEDGYPRVEDVTDEELTEVLGDPDMYDFEVNKNQYHRSSDALWSGGIGSLEENPDGAKYDDDLAALLRPLSDEDIEAAAKKLGNDSPYISFGYRNEAVDKEFFETSFFYTIGETEGWHLEAKPNINKITNALDEKLDERSGEPGAKPATVESIVYRFNGSNDSIAGASGRGMYVASLKPTELGKEGATLGICVGRKDMPYCRKLRAGEIAIYSVRTEAGKPKFTIEVTLDGSGNPVRVAQVKGKANRIPGFDPGSTSFTKPDEVRLVVEFLRKHLNFSEDAIRRTSDMAAGVQALTDSGVDPFAPPPSKRREMTATSLEVQGMALVAMSEPWGFEYMK